MARLALDAVFENGGFRLLASQKVGIPEGQRVRILVEPVEQNGDVLALAMQVYDGLSVQEIAEVEQIALDRRTFFSEREDE